VSYEEIRADLAERYHWTFDTIDNMSLEQIASAMSSGKKPKGIPIENAEEAKDMTKNWRIYYGI
jgi:hypothetical protein